MPDLVGVAALFVLGRKYKPDSMIYKVRIQILQRKPTVSTLEQSLQILIKENNGFVYVDTFSRQLSPIEIEVRDVLIAQGKKYSRASMT